MTYTLIKVLQDRVEGVLRLEGFTGITELVGASHGEVELLDEAFGSVELFTGGHLARLLGAASQAGERIVTQILGERQASVEQSHVLGLDVGHEHAHLRLGAVALHVAYDGHHLELLQCAHQGSHGTSGSLVVGRWHKDLHVGHEVLARDARCAREADQVETFVGRVLEQTLVHLGEGHQSAPVAVALLDVVLLDHQLRIGQTVVGAFHAYRRQRIVAALHRTTALL
mmetsp:Transcript_46179/g.116281  ORF Transcript_46179/g.116281 Transcript_46179/m.116281 type:complete len:227 (-) Transcript_46179:451-1131(-)